MRLTHTSKVVTVALPRTRPGGTLLGSVVPELRRFLCAACTCGWRGSLLTLDWSRADGERADHQAAVDAGLVRA